MQLTVLLVEQDSERGKRLEFLLRLAEYDVRHFACVAEAINWRMTCSPVQETGLCLLLGTPGPLPELTALLQQLHCRNIELPVVLVNRIPPVRPARLDWLRQLAGLGVHVCEPSEISAAIATICQQDRSRLTWNKERTLSAGGNHTSNGLMTVDGSTTSTNVYPHRS